MSGVATGARWVGAVALGLVLAGCGKKGSGQGSGGSGGSTGRGPDLPELPDVGADLPPEPVCGNGVVEPGEECDDGDLEDGDGCQGDCTYPAYGGEGLVASWHCTCVYMPSGRLRCWGRASCNGYGYAVGDDETPAEAGDVPAPGPLVKMAPVAGGGCALLEGGSVRCWGAPYESSLPKGVVLGQGEPIVNPPWTLAAALEVPLPGPARDVAASDLHRCAALEDGDLYCWGYNGSGQLGLGHTENVGDDETPVEAGPVDVGGKVVQVAIGSRSFHTCVLLEGGAVRCFGAQREDTLICGWNAPPEACPNYGSLGTGQGENVGDDEVPGSVPPVELGGPAVEVQVANVASCALREDGALFCWGLGWASMSLGLEQAGDDETPLEAGPVAAEGVKGWSMGESRLFCLNEVDGDWRCAGGLLSGFGWVGVTLDGMVPLADLLASPVRTVDSGMGRECAMLEDGSVRCWGENQSDWLGYGLGVPLNCSCFDDISPTICCIGDDEPLSELPPVPYE